jgi:DNA-binding protein Fis
MRIAEATDTTFDEVAATGTVVVAFYTSACIGYRDIQPRKQEPSATLGTRWKQPRRRRRLDLEAFLHQRLGPDSRALYKETLRELDRLLLPRVLEYTGGNQQRAALLLGIARRTLREKLRDLGLHVAHSVEADDDNLP